MFARQRSLFLGSILFAQAVLGYPKDVAFNSALHTRTTTSSLPPLETHGQVQYSKGTQYDGNEDGCMRYKYAWSTVVNERYNEWTPNPDRSSLFEFKACSGGHLDQNIHDQMDKLTRQKMVMLQAGGNDPVFYPMADSCLFHSDTKKQYVKKYEDDDPENPEGECRIEINLVRGRLAGDNMMNLVKDTIETWKSHPAVGGNDATLFMLGWVCGEDVASDAGWA